MEGGFMETLAIFDWKWIFVSLALVLLRFYFKGKQFNERVTAKKLVVAVTGCNCGIGKQIVRELNLRGAKVYLLCRNEGRVNECLIELAKLGCNPERLIFKEVDLTKFSTIKRAVEEIKQAETHLDILINNAGVLLYPRFKLTDDGHELVWQTNYLGHFLLTELLLPLMRQAPSARIVNVSAMSHHFSDRIDPSTIDRREYWDSMESYAKSKLAMVMHAHQMTKRLRAAEATNICINSCHPGLCYTRLFRHTPLAKIPLKYIIAPFAWYFLKTPKDGAQTPLYLALSKHVAGVSGQYFSECGQKEEVKMDKWDEKCEKLYMDSIEACGLHHSIE